MKYQKKPVVVDAFQMTKEHRWDNRDWPEWLNAAWQMCSGGTGAFWCLKNNPDHIFIRTSEGAERITYNDWIIRGVRGELYPCKPDIFEETYGEMEDQEERVEYMSKGWLDAKAKALDLQGKIDRLLDLICTHEDASRTKIKGLQKLTEDIVRLRRATAILDERDRQDELWGEQDHTLPEWMVILTEEVGELAAAVSDILFHTNHPEKNWREEAVQVAAVALAMLEQYQGTE